MSTNISNTTRLSEEDQRACWAAILTTGEITNESPLLPWPLTAASDAVTLLQQHISTLAADLARAEAENARLNERTRVLEHWLRTATAYPQYRSIGGENNTVELRISAQTYRNLRAALNGGDND